MNQNLEHLVKINQSKCLACSKKSPCKSLSLSLIVTKFGQNIHLHVKCHPAPQAHETIDWPKGGATS